ncbi:MAG TPA: aminotransferase class III-fold pyridoxal phosphate-dependent enzyme [Bacillota bacterium]|nr:aminotransferase class III-fold pyridoxal phosphate-dependent enzyme [Bacillota bacterium]
MSSNKFLTVADALNLNRKQTLDLYREHVNSGLADMLAATDLDLNFVQAEGALVWDDEGKEYLDLDAGDGTLNLGHNPPAVYDAINKVKGSPVLLQPYLSRLTAALAHNLALMAPGELKHCFFCNSSSEAVEAALKLARAATGRKRMVYCDGAMHGYTMGALSVSGADFYCRPFAPLLPECQKIPYGDTIALEMVLRDEQAACFIVEPILVEGGVIIPGKGYLQKVREICNRYGTLLIVDESKTGLGRCGSVFACTLAETIPDIICLPRFLGGGVIPVSGIITTAELWKRAYGDSEKCLLHNSSFGGNALAMAAALTVLNETIEQELSLQAQEKGAYLLQKLEELAAENSLVREVRGEGLLIGIELNPPVDNVRQNIAGKQDAGRGDEQLASQVVKDLLKRHRIICSYTRNNPLVLRVTPSLKITYEQMDMFVEALQDTLEKLLGSAEAPAVQPALPAVFIVAHDDAFPPWVFLQEGVSAGIGVDIFTELARRNNITIKFIGATWSSIFPLVTNKQIDLILNAGWPNPYLDDFPIIASEPYAQFESHLFMKRDPSEPKITISLEELEGKRIGVQRASIVASLLKKTGAEVVEYDNDTLSFLDHFWNKTDYVAAEKMVGLNLNQTFFQGCFQIVSEPICQQQVVCLTHKDNSALMAKINEEIESLKKEQIIKQIYEKYNRYSGPRRLEAKIRAIKG